MDSIQQNIKISYAICTHNETKSLANLLDLIKIHMNSNDEIVIVDDYSTDVFTKTQIKRADTLIYKKLNNNFASQKNIFFQVCKGDYIFNIDADEVPSEFLLKDIKKLCKQNPSIDLFYVPRKNYLLNASKQNIKNMGRVLDDKSRINYPDYQGRIYKNKSSLRWENIVHERIVGHTREISLNTNSQYFLLHEKEYQIQVKSEEFYKKLKKIQKIPKNKKMAFVCCYFNPCNYKSKFTNYLKFKKRLVEQGHTLLTVESFNKESKYRLTNHTENLISIYSDSIFWQKENLLNIGMKSLVRDGFEYITWLDIDIEFVSENWYEKLVNDSSKNDVTQIFGTVLRQESFKSKERKLRSSVFYLKQIKKNKNILEQLLLRNGEPGYGYCYHKNILNYEIFDKAILGTGDFLNLIGMNYSNNFRQIISKDRFFKNLSKDFIDEYCKWSKEISSKVINIGYADITLKVSYHGDLEDRMYVSRESILGEYNFSPTLQLHKESTGIYRLINKKLENRIKKYFQERNEDKHIDENIVPKKLKPKIKNELLDKFKVNQDSKFIVIGSIYTSEKISLNRVNLDNKILIDTSNIPCKNSYSFNEENKYKSHYYNYFKFISTFYEELPEFCIFLASGIGRCDYVNLLNNKIKNKKEISQFDFFCDYSEFKIKTKKNSMIRNTILFEDWWKLITSKEYNPNLKYTPTPSFIASRDLILSNSREFYLDLLHRLESDIVTYNFLIERTFRYIFV